MYLILFEILFVNFLNITFNMSYFVLEFFLFARKLQRFAFSIVVPLSELWNFAILDQTEIHGDRSSHISSNKNAGPQGGKGLEFLAVRHELYLERDPPPLLRFFFVLGLVLSWPNDSLEIRERSRFNGKTSHEFRFI